MNMRPAAACGLLALALLPLAGCVTPSGGAKKTTKPVAQQPAPAVSQDKQGTKTEPAGGPVAVPPETPPIASEPAPAPAPEAPALPSQTELVRWVRVQSSPTSTFGARDHELLGVLPDSPEPGSVEEAALVLGIVKSLLHPLSATGSTFREADLGGARTVRGKALNLEQLCKQRGVNVVDALIENPLLATHGFARQVLEALRIEGGGTPAFRTEVTVALRNQVAFWNQIAQELGVGAPVAAAEPQDAPPPPADAPPPNPADLRAGDSVLGEAQALADRGDYRAAIRKASVVEPGSPMHPMAQEKIRDFSNLAVQELRRKAAQAFQSALPINDRKTRAAYLQQAKTYLEEAITSYPYATQLPTVRDNLRVISRDLEKLETEGATKGG